MADFDVTVQMNGLEELNKKLQGLSYDVQKKGGRFALRKAAQVLRDAARASARQVDDGQTGRSIAANINERWNGRLNKRTGDLGFRLGVSQGARLPQAGESSDESAGGPTPHWRLLEFGTEKMPARPFFQPAVEGNLQRATDVFMKQFDAAIGRALKKQGK